jgi:hypothetical protein
LDSNPSPDIKRLLDSARLDRPAMDSKVRAKARALAVLRERELGTTTQLTAFELGGTISRLLSAVTLVDKPVSIWRLAVQGATIGTLVGAAALTVLVMQRYLHAPEGTLTTAVAGHSIPLQQEGTESIPPFDTRTQNENSVENALSLMERDVREGRPELALERLKPISTTKLAPNDFNHATILRVRALVALGRNEEAKRLVLASPLVTPTQEQKEALERALLGQSL